ncbi:MAG: type II toxin-antitoxin system HicB family antitoxin [Parachlamydiaceae bacterium]
MELEGKIWKNKNHWLVEVSSLNIMTQGNTRDEALYMIQDAIIEYMKYYFKSKIEGFKLEINDYKKSIIGISSNNNKLLLALSLIKQREKSGSTIRQASERLGSKSPNSYAQYEKGNTRISLDQYERLLQAANPYQHRLLRVI